jgi:hypothetical protein
MMGSPDGRDIRVGLVDWVSYQRHVSCFLVFPVGGVRFNMQDFWLFPTILCPSSHANWVNFDFSSRPRVCETSVRVIIREDGKEDTQSLSLTTG